MMIRMVEAAVKKGRLVTCLSVVLVLSGCIGMLKPIGLGRSEKLLVYEASNPFYPFRGTTFTGFEDHTFFHIVNQEFRNETRYPVQNLDQFIEIAKSRGISLDVRYEAPPPLGLRRRSIFHLSWRQSDLPAIYQLSRDLGISFLVSTKHTSHRIEQLYPYGDVFVVTAEVTVHDVKAQRVASRTTITGHSLEIKNPVYRVGLTSERNDGMLYKHAVGRIVSRTDEVLSSLASNEPTPETRTVFLFSMNPLMRLRDIQRASPKPLDEQYEDRTVYQRLAAHLGRLGGMTVVNELVLGFLKEAGVTPQYSLTSGFERNQWIGPIEIMWSRGKNCPVPSDTLEHLTVPSAQFDRLKWAAPSAGIDWVVGFEIVDSGWRSDYFEVRWRMVIVESRTGREHRHNTSTLQKTRTILFPGLGIDLGSIKVTPYHGKVDSVLQAMAAEIVSEGRRAFGSL